jgi:predicted RNA-binding Zn ribbon-like protein
MIRRSFIKIGGDLAIDFANTTAPEGDRPQGDRQDSLGSWRDLIDFLELRGAVSPDEGVGLRAMGERDAHACAAAFERALELRATVRAMLEALAARRPLQAGWVAAVNQALGWWGTGASRLVRQGRGWRLAFASTLGEPLRALAPIARSVADLAAQGRAVAVRKCANPRCVLYFRDTSRTRRRRWCSMAVCGNRMKVAAHTRRHGRRRSA